MGRPYCGKTGSWGPTTSHLMIIKPVGVRIWTYYKPLWPRWESSSYKSLRARLCRQKGCLLVWLRDLLTPCTVLFFFYTPQNKIFRWLGAMYCSASTNRVQGASWRLGAERDPNDTSDANIFGIPFVVWPSTPLETYCKIQSSDRAFPFKRKTAQF